MSVFRRRPSPAMLVALLALVLAMTGTAAAAVLVSSPDQLGSVVVTNPKIATDAVSSRALDEPSVSSGNLTDRAVTNSKLATSGVDGRALAFNSVNSSHLVDRQVFSDDLRNPVFSASVDIDGTTSTARSVGVDLSLTRKLGNDQTAAGLYSVGFRQDVRNCTIAATPATAMGVTATAFRGSLDPRVVTVALSKPNLIGDEIGARGVDGAFSVIAQC